MGKNTVRVRRQLITEKHWKHYSPVHTCCIIEGTVSSDIHRNGFDPVIQPVFYPIGLKYRQSYTAHLLMNYLSTSFSEEIDTISNPSV